MRRSSCWCVSNKAAANSNVDRVGPKGSPSHAHLDALCIGYPNGLTRSEPTKKGVLAHARNVPYDAFPATCQR
jgi:hypothetical protein